MSEHTSNASTGIGFELCWLLGWCPNDNFVPLYAQQHNSVQPGYHPCDAVQNSSET